MLLWPPDFLKDKPSVATAWQPQSDLHSLCGFLHKSLRAFFFPFPPPKKRRMVGVVKEEDAKSNGLWCYIYMHIVKLAAACRPALGLNGAVFLHQSWENWRSAAFFWKEKWRQQLLFKEARVLCPWCACSSTLEITHKFEWRSRIERLVSTSRGLCPHEAEQCWPKPFKSNSSGSSISFLWLVLKSVQERFLSLFPHGEQKSISGWKKGTWSKMTNRYVTLPMKKWN